MASYLALYRHIIIWQHWTRTNVGSPDWHYTTVQRLHDVRHDMEWFLYARELEDFIEVDENM